MRQFPESAKSLPPASLFKRLAAMLYDSMIVMAIWMLISGIGVTLNGGEAVAGPLFKSAVFLVTFLFFAGFWTRSGQTLGMQAWRIRIQSDEGYTLSWMQALIRFFMAIVSAIFFGLGYWWILFDSQKRSWHDRYSDSRVVQLPKPVKKKSK